MSSCVNVERAIILVHSTYLRLFRVMPRLPTIGVSIASPHGNVDAFDTVLKQLRVREHFEAAEIAQIHLRLARIVGAWTAENGRLSSKATVRRLHAIGKNLLDIADTLGALQNNPRPQ